MRKTTLFLAVVFLVVLVGGYIFARPINLPDTGGKRSQKEFDEINIGEKIHLEPEINRMFGLERNIELSADQEKKFRRKEAEYKKEWSKLRSRIEQTVEQMKKVIASEGVEGKEVEKLIEEKNKYLTELQISRLQFSKEIFGILTVDQREKLPAENLIRFIDEKSGRGAGGAGQKKERKKYFDTLPGDKNRDNEEIKFDNKKWPESPAEPENR